MSSTPQAPMPAMTRSKVPYTPQRSSVTPCRLRAKTAVGVEPTLTMGTAYPAARSLSAASTAMARSFSAAAMQHAAPWHL